jgi:hypothetical protein
LSARAPRALAPQAGGRHHRAHPQRNGWRLILHDIAGYAENVAATLAAGPIRPDLVVVGYSWSFHRLNAFRSTALTRSSRCPRDLARTALRRGLNPRGPDRAGHLEPVLVAPPPLQPRPTCDSGCDSDRGAADVGPARPRRGDAAGHLDQRRPAPPARRPPPRRCSTRRPICGNRSWRRVSEEHGPSGHPITGVQLSHPSRARGTRWTPGNVGTDPSPGHQFRHRSRDVRRLEPPRREPDRTAVRGRPVGALDTYTLALSSYRQGGGGGYAMLQSAPVVYDRNERVREPLVEDLRRVLDLGFRLGPADRAVIERGCPATVPPGACPRGLILLRTRDERPPRRARVENVPLVGRAAGGERAGLANRATAGRAVPMRDAASRRRG